MRKRTPTTSVAGTSGSPVANRCDGRAFARFLSAGTFFLRKYRSVVNDLNVFPVPDGDTGTNMFLTVRAGMLAAGRTRSEDLSAVCAAAALGSLTGARGNSGVIVSQMFRGFAHAVRHRQWIETRDLAPAMHDAVAAARQSLLKPLEGTILSVAGAAAGAAFKTAASEPDFFPVLHAIVDAAHAALERTPEQLSVLAQSNVVDAGGQGLVYFLEGALRMLPGKAPYTTAFPRRPVRRTTFTARQIVDRRRFCTEFMLAGSNLEAAALRELLADQGDSLIVAGGDHLLRVHIHTDYPNNVVDAASQHGSVSALKVDNMEAQHDVLVVDREAKARGVVCVVPGEGFAKICKELGADVTVLAARSMNPSVEDLLVAVSAVHAPFVYLFANNKNTIAAARELASLAQQTVTVVPTTNMPEGIAALFALINQNDGAAASPETLVPGSSLLASGSIFRSGISGTFGGVHIERGEIVGAPDGVSDRSQSLIKGPNSAAIAVALTAAAVAEPSLLTIYYGSAVKLKEAKLVAEALRAAYPKTPVETYYGGQQASEYILSIER